MTLKDGGDLQKVIKEFIKKVKAELPLDMDVDNTYKIIFFTESKKRYAGLTVKGEIVVRGLEVRRSRRVLAKELQSEVIRIILEEENAEKAAKFVKETIALVREGKVPLSKLIINKTLTKARAAMKARRRTCMLRKRQKPWIYRPRSAIRSAT